MNPLVGAGEAEEVRRPLSVFKRFYNFLHGVLVSFYALLLELVLLFDLRAFLIPRGAGRRLLFGPLMQWLPIRGSERVPSGYNGRVKSKNLVTKCLIGKGSSGIFYETTWLGYSGSRLARKDFPGVKGDIFEWEAIRLFKLPDHPNLLKTFCWTVDNRSCSLVMEYLRDDLSSVVRRKKEELRKKQANPPGIGPAAPFELHEVLEIAIQIATGMEYLHLKGITHGDLKANNIFIDWKDWKEDKMLVKLADFGLLQTKRRSTVVSQRAFCFQMMEWSAPELFEDYFRSTSEDLDYLWTKSPIGLETSTSSFSTFNKVSMEQADSYSFALICAFVLGGQMWNAKLSPSELRREISNSGLRPTLPSECPKTLRSLISLCWDTNPESRPTFSYIREKLQEEQRNLQEGDGPVAAPSLPPPASIPSPAPDISSPPPLRAPNPSPFNPPNSPLLKKGGKRKDVGILVIVAVVLIAVPPGMTILHSFRILRPTLPSPPPGPIRSLPPFRILRPTLPSPPPGPIRSPPPFRILRPTLPSPPPGPIRSPPPFRILRPTLPSPPPGPIRSPPPFRILRPTLPSPPPGPIQSPPPFTLSSRLKEKEGIHFRLSESWPPKWMDGGDEGQGELTPSLPQKWMDGGDEGPPFTPSSRLKEKEGIHFILDGWMDGGDEGQGELTPSLPQKWMDGGDEGPPFTPSSRLKEKEGIHFILDGWMDGGDEGQGELTPSLPQKWMDGGDEGPPFTPSSRLKEKEGIHFILDGWMDGGDEGQGELTPSLPQKWMDGGDEGPPFTPSSRLKEKEGIHFILDGWMDGGDEGQGELTPSLPQKWMDGGDEGPPFTPSSRLKEKEGIHFILDGWMDGGDEGQGELTPSLPQKWMDGGDEGPPFTPSSRLKEKEGIHFILDGWMDGGDEGQGELTPSLPQKWMDGGDEGQGELTPSLPKKWMDGGDEGVVCCPAFAD